MATVSKIGSVTAGIYTNPNTLSRSMSAAYTALGTQINTLADIFSYNQGAPVQDVLDMRWTWNFLAPTARSGTITTINSGLSGTSVFTYAGDDYQSVNPLFRVVRPGFPAESRPATIYETFLQYKTYIDTTIAAEASRLATLVSTFNYNLVGVDDGSLLISNQAAIAGSQWRTSYLSGVYTLNAPLGYAKFSGASDYLELAGPKIRIQNYLSLKGIDQENVDQTVPTADEGRGNLYFSSVDKKVHVIDEDGLDITFGEGTTGDITFDGVKIIGAGTASGDGLNRSTIELVPDIDRYLNDQYLIIDPTIPDHIHIRAGVNPDESSAVLILGGEKSNVSVSDSEIGHVKINSKTVDGNSTSTWAFEGGESSGKGTLRCPGWLNSQSYNNTNGSLVVSDSATVTAWTGNQYESTAKVIVQGQWLNAGQWETQSCEVLLVRQVNTNTVNHITYGVVYTGTSPFFNVSSSVEVGTGNTLLQITNLKTTNLYISTFVTTIGSYD